MWALFLAELLGEKAQLADAASGVHQLVLLHGREAARGMVPTKQRMLVDIAAEVLADEGQTIGISYTGFCLTSLPHKKLADDAAWEKRGYRVSLMVEPGRMRVRGKTQLYGVPYGARARMILLYLQTQAVRTGSREIELGRSMRAWLERMGIAYGGETAKALREQAARISACSLKFFWDDERGADGWAAGRIVTSGLRFHTLNGDGQESLWEDRVELDPDLLQGTERPPGAVAGSRDTAAPGSLHVPRPIRVACLAATHPGEADLYFLACHIRPVRRGIPGAVPLQTPIHRSLGGCGGLLSGSKGGDGG